MIQTAMSQVTVSQVTMSQGHYGAEVERSLEKVTTVELSFFVIEAACACMFNLDGDNESRTLRGRSRKVIGKGHYCRVVLFY